MQTLHVYHLSNLTDRNGQITTLQNILLKNKNKIHKYKN